MKSNHPVPCLSIRDTRKACATWVIRCRMGLCYAGLDNELFYMDKTMMVFGEARKTVEDIVKAVE
ncbi:MAG TPA: NAD(P)(+) transhydrogenase (Re/Si-specific) subunit beta [Burkholderiales bacterium]|nr:NAD(P)(+) transhydrogenase (Re/Si-specific) subunit beta [Burkholderiales bacterium]